MYRATKIIDYDLCATRSERECVLPAKTATGPSDDSDFAIKTNTHSALSGNGRRTGPQVIHAVIHISTSPVHRLKKTMNY
jgi:hypothetical protein